jgi:glucose-6-phosphate isomerase
MLPKIDPSSTLAWHKLKNHYTMQKETSLNSFFTADDNRFEKFSIELDELLFDFSKNRVSVKTMELLLELVNECQLTEAIQAMFSDEKINETENKAFLHTALRDFSKKEILVDGQNVAPLIQKERNRIKQLCAQIHGETWLGCTDKPIRNIVNIGIGGSDLGPSMVTEALRPYWNFNIKPHFISNVDGSNLFEVLHEIELDETLFLVASKTFTTQETMTNAHTVREVFLRKFKEEALIPKHFLAITGNMEEANKFGIPSENIFEVWDWVGGR